MERQRAVELSVIFTRHLFLDQPHSPLGCPSEKRLCQDTFNLIELLSGEEDVESIKAIALPRVIQC